MLVQAVSALRDYSDYFELAMSSMGWFERCSWQGNGVWHGEACHSFQLLCFAVVLEAVKNLESAFLKYSPQRRHSRERSIDLILELQMLRHRHATRFCQSRSFSLSQAHTCSYMASTTTVFKWTTPRSHLSGAPSSNAKNVHCTLC